MSIAWPNLYPTLSRPLEAPKLRAVSFGAGVQSTTMLLMAALGEIGPMPDVAIFADTGDEPEHVYETLRWVRSANVALPFPVEVVQAGSIREQLLGWANGEHSRANGRPPLFVPRRDPETGRLKVGRTKRQCTQDWKIVPIERRVRELAGVKPRSPGPKSPIVEQWIGISTDEITRLSPNPRRWIHNRHPLVEIGFNRQACENWLRDRFGVRVRKSACRVCTFHSDAEWQLMRTEHPADFEAACQVDDALRAGSSLMLRGEPYLHRSCRPLREVVFKSLATDEGLTSWAEECRGMCGL